MNLPLEGESLGQGNPAGPIRPSKPFGESSKPITMATIAKMAGVSQGAISSLLNDRDYGIRVSDKTRERVFKVCRELGYVPNDLRAEVRMYPETGDTCLLVSDKLPGGLSHPFVTRIANSLLGCLKQVGMGIARYSEAEDYSTDESSLPTAIRNGTASKFICVGAPNPSLCKIIQRRGYPVIVIGHESHVSGTTSVLPDYSSAANLALSHLSKLGHQNVGIVGGPFGSPDPRLAEMNRAIGIAAPENAIAISTQDIFHGDLSFAAGLSAFHSITERNAPTALLCLSDLSACGVIAGAASRGVDVPRKLSVLALTDHSEPLPSIIPVTAVISSIDELVTAAASEADRQVREGLPTNPVRILVPSSIQCRTSTGTAVR
jgi:LacI family transcriptional regulator